MASPATFMAAEESQSKGISAPPPGMIVPKEGGSTKEQPPVDLGPNNQDLEKKFPKVAAALRVMVSEFRMEGIVGRRHEIRRIKKNRLFWQGLQYSYGWDADQQEWQMPFGTSAGLRQTEDEEAEQGGRYEFVNNIYQADGLTFIAVMSQDVPTVNWYPQQPNNDQDIAAAKAASEAEKLIAENNKVEELMINVGFWLWTDGKVGAYVRWVADGQRFGFHDNPIVEAQPQKMGEDAFTCPNCGAQTPAGSLYSGSICPQCGTPLSQDNFQQAPTVPVPVVTGYNKVPNGQETITIVGGLELNTPVWAYHLYEMPYLQWQLEVHKSKLKASYPWVADKIIPGNPNDADDVYARASRIAVEQGLPTTHPGDALATLITYTRNWIRPWAFFAIEDKDVRETALALFPDGCYAAFAGDTYCESRNESVDDHWRVLHALPGDGQNRPAVGDSLVPLQEQLNTCSNQRMEAFDFSYPPIYADPQVLDFDAISNRDAEPGSHVPARARAGQPLGNGFFQPNAASYPADWVEFQANLEGSQAQRVTGLYPAIFGGEMPGSETLGEYSIAREQAMGRLGLIWRKMKSWWADVMLLAVDCFRKNRTEDVQMATLSEDGEYESKAISVADLQGNIQARAEVDDKYPRLKSQQRGTLQQLMAFAPESPEIAAIFNEPANMREIKSILGLRDFVIPGEDSGNKQLREIEFLLQGQPIQVMPPPAAAAPGQPPQPQQPQLVSTIPVDPLLDRHDIEFQEGLRWANSPVGIKARRENPMGFANVRAHLQEHQQAMPKPGQPKPPAESVNYKDLTPSGKVQMAAQAGIQENPLELMAKEVQDRQDKKDEMKAKFANKGGKKNGND